MNFDVNTLTALMSLLGKSNTVDGSRANPPSDAPRGDNSGGVGGLFDNPIFAILNGLNSNGQQQSNPIMSMLPLLMGLKGGGLFGNPSGNPQGSSQGNFSGNPQGNPSGNPLSGLFGNLFGNNAQQNSKSGADNGNTPSTAAQPQDGSNQYDNQNDIDARDDRNMSQNREYSVQNRPKYSRSSSEFARRKPFDEVAFAGAEVNYLLLKLKSRVGC